MYCGHWQTREYRRISILSADLGNRARPFFVHYPRPQTPEKENNTEPGAAGSYIHGAFSGEFFTGSTREGRKANE